MIFDGSEMRSEKVLRSPNIKACDLKLMEDLFVIPDDDNFILYEPKKPSVLTLNKAAVKALQDFKKGNRNRLDPNSAFVKQLIAAGILSMGKTENQRMQFRKGETGFDPEGVSLFLTSRCSMRCIYCYSNGGDNPKFMPWSTAKAAIDWIVDHATARGRSSLDVSFHGGGEITTAMTLMRRCVEYVRQQAGNRGIIVRIEAGLNGVMNHQTVDWAVQNLDGATVSLDGLPEVQNFQRPLSNGRDSFPVVSAALRRMDAKEFRYSIRSK